MAIYKRGAAGRTYAEAADAMSFPKPADGIMRIVGTGHSFTAPGYRTLPAITRAAGFQIGGLDFGHKFLQLFAEIFFAE